jgi:hypothetical protein
MVWIPLGTYITAIEDDPQLYDSTGRWVEILRDPLDPKPYTQVEVAAELEADASYWYVTEDVTDITVSRLRVTPKSCRNEPWLTVPKSVFAPGKQTKKVRLAFALADARPESAPRFLRNRLLRAPCL